MNHVPCLTVTSLLAVTMLLMVPGAAVAGWRVIPTSGFVTADPDLDVRKPMHLEISTQVVGDHLIHQTLPTVEGDVIDAIAVCAFAIPSFLTSFINAILLMEFIFPGFESLRHVDETHVPRTIATGPGEEVQPCYVSSMADYAPAGAVELLLRLHFGSSSTFISIGAVAVHVK
jgi:hypothetical protein